MSVIADLFEKLIEKMDGKVILCDGRQLAKPQHQKGEDTDMKGQGFRCEATEKNEILEITSEK